MLDKTVPYYSLIMKRKGGLPIPEWELPAGYRFSSFAEGKERDWAEIEVSVGEFSDVEQALQYFGKEYAPFPADLPRRVLLIEGPDGQCAGTVSAWWSENEGRRVPCLHWLSVKPECQALGLGKALVSRCLRIFEQVDAGKDIYLHTQTWSHRAVGLYLKAGFDLLKRESFGSHSNEYEKALPILQERVKGV